MNESSKHQWGELLWILILFIFIEGALLLVGIKPRPLSGTEVFVNNVQTNIPETQKTNAAPATLSPTIGQPKNPFLAYLTDGNGFRYEPLLGYSNANDYGQGFAVDYFGFRNRGFPYAKSDNRRIIVITGNSELRGVHHTQGSIAELLEKALFERIGEKFRVINMGMDGYTLAYETSAFMHLAYHLHPAAVISHSFYLDMHHCYVAPTEYSRLGLCFNAHLAPKWAPLISPGNVQPDAFSYAGHKSREVVLDSLILNLRKYKEIAEASGAVFVFGLQKFEERFSVGSPTEMDVKAYRVLQKRLASHMRSQTKDRTNFIDFNDTDYKDVEIVDGVHTSASSAKVIANAYADHLAPLIRR